MKTGTDLINEAKTRIREITPRDAKALRASDPGVVFLDVREPAEYGLGHVPNSVFIPRGTLEGKVEAAIPRDANVVIYCAGGNRSALAADTMQQMGYTNVTSMIDGWRGWVGVGGEVEG